MAANPLPVVDLLSTAAVNGQMVLEIARVYGIALTKERARELAVSVGRTLAGLGMVKGALSLITPVLSLSLPTLIIGRGVQAVATAWLTRIAGASFIRYFEQDQDWGDGGIQKVVQDAFELNRREVARASRTAMRQAVSRCNERQLGGCRHAQRPGGEDASTAGIQHRDQQQIDHRDGN